MVVFTCGHCGESVQKPKVEKHYLTKCRNRNPNLSCMDCFKDFLGNDYEAHTKCITEEERYSGKGFTAKEKKGEKKQNAWVEMLQSVLDEQKSAPSNVLRIIETISKHNNTPRKKPKFVNFVKNVCGHKTHPRDIDQAWDLISVKLAALSLVNNQNNKSQATANGDADESKDDEQETDTANGSVNNEITEDKADDEETKTNGHSEQQNGHESNKNLSKKQRKEEKKRRKYEAELQSATEPVEDIEENVTEVKKGKKKKNKSISESTNGEVEENDVDSKGKNKKRKRQDTVCSVNGNNDVADEGETPVAAPVAAKEKTVKKKLKVEDELDQESDTLHNQNVAKIEELSMKGDKFDWHAVIMSVLEKKDNEMPFKRLQKKVLSEYMEMTGRDIDDRIADKFIKKLRSAPKVRVDKNRVYIEV